MNKEKVYLTVIVLLAIALIVGCALQAQQTSKRLSVSEIIVPKEGLTFKTEDGKVIAFMVATKDGGMLGVFNNQEKAVAIMGAGENGGTLGILNNQGKSAAGMAALENGGSLSIYNNQGKSVARMGAGELGGSLGVLNNQGKTVAVI